MSVSRPVAVEDMKLDLGDGIHADAQLRRGTRPILIVQLRAAIDRQKIKLPAFHPAAPRLKAFHQLSIADPCLERFPDIGAGWYLGWQGMPIWERLSAAIKDLAKTLDVGRVFYIGGSSAGFAALLLSHNHDDSLAIVRSPQINLRLYNAGIRRKYFEVAWGSADPTDEVPFDLAALYQKDASNRIIYLISPDDRTHLHLQTPQFIALMNRKRWADFVFDCRYYGKPGHSSSVPLDTLFEWVDIALAVDPDAQDWRCQILTEHFNRQSQANLTPPSPRRPAVPDWPAADIDIARHITRYELR